MLYKIVSYKKRDFEHELVVCLLRMSEYYVIFPEPTARSAVRRGLLIPHGYLHPGKCEHSEVQSSSMIAGASLWLIGGPPTDLKNMVDCQEWKGQRFKKIYVRKYGGPDATAQKQFSYL